MKLSVIVPVYNVEKYIEECINSLLLIHSIEMEILIIDDGSTDKSIKIVETYSDGRIKVITQKNKGLSGARNTGLKNASGEYILFIDSDDYIINQNEILNMINFANNHNCDIVIASGERVYENGEKRTIKRSNKIYDFKFYTGIDYIKMNIKNKCFIQVVWLNLYKKDFLEKNNLYFKENIYHEDLDFTPRALLKANKIGIYNAIFYQYRQRENSITKVVDQTKNGKDIYNTIKELYDFFQLVDDKELLKLLNNWYFQVLIEAIVKVYKNDKKTVNDIIYFINKLNNIGSFNYKIIKFLLNINDKIAYKYIIFLNKLKIFLKNILKR